MIELLIVVPARGGSKRLPGKNLRRLAGKPMLAHTADAIRGAGIRAPCLLTTDDDEIAAVGQGLGWMVPFRRPPHLAADASSTEAAVLHAVDWFAAANGGDPAAVMVLQPTSPLRGSACLVEGVRLLAARPQVNSVVAMRPLHLSPARLYVADGQGLLAAIAPEDRRTPVLVPNGALYLTRIEALRSTGSLYAPPVAAVTMDAFRSTDIDTEDDLRLAETLLAAGLPLPPPPAAKD
jgi:CMP-N-acetylneuraminic acid synthetase